jgi:uroporphyrinogen-III synthase
MPVAQTAFDCLLITRPQPEAEDLARRLAIPGLEIVLQPAHQFCPVEIGAAELQALQAATEKAATPLLVFTSTRAVNFALRQLPMALLGRCRLAAIGSATARALQQAGQQEVIQPAAGYRSEDLLHTLDELAKGWAVPAKDAWIVAAAGGRKALLEGLHQRGLSTRMLLVYRRQAAAVTPDSQRLLQQCRRILSVWTSADAMQQLSRGLSGPAWSRVCAGEWLVTSGRLADIAAGFQPAAMHQSAGPGNAELAASIEQICRP